MGTDLGGVAEPTQTSGAQRLWSVVIVASAEQLVLSHRGPGMAPLLASEALGNVWVQGRDDYQPMKEVLARQGIG
ncbi:hypothetical protein [Dictyobacter formicarum]|uniref:Uncharacterized protein n=1 Tax=Dictyobacter formicarum TaxID=2778368 RepID=A0ABQ3VN71_9CHLR|nr:hypothetical protein [Dictyobacter formicarum]GHO87114.1 hypothetical protein KSZ_51200 [Dictyobacter formicarum]